MHSRLRTFLLSLMLTWLVGCEAPAPSMKPEPEPSTSSVRLAVTLPTAAPGDVTRVTVTVSASDMASRTVDLVLTAQEWGGTLGDLPAGSQRTFLAQAFNAAQAPRYEGRADNVTLTAGTTGLVSITLRETPPLPPFTNEPPVVDALVATPSSVAPGGQVSLSASVHDPNAGDSLSYQWTAPLGGFSTPTQASTTWTAPASPGPVRLTLTVSDSRGTTVMREVLVEVLAASAPARWSPTGAMPTQRYQFPTLLLNNGQVLVSGGFGTSAALAQSETYEPTTGAFTATGALRAVRMSHTVLVLPDGKVLAAGGWNPSGSSGGPLASAELYNPATGTWSTTGAMTSPREGHTQTLLTTGKVLVAAGYSTRVLATAELYDPATGTWSATGSLSTPRRFATAIALATGKVLVMGGNNAGSIQATAELYDPATGTWSPTGSMTTARFEHTATLLPDGKVLVAGGNRGNNNTLLATAEVYDPATGTWSLTGPMTTTRTRHAAVRLSSGKVLVLGGYDGASVLATAELYDPATGTWSPTASLSTPRTPPLATLLPTGKVLAVGGHDGADHVRTAELYDPGS